MHDQFVLLDEIVNEREIEYAEHQAVFAQQVTVYIRIICLALQMEILISENEFGRYLVVVLCTL
mgnify:CR=1 FL=1